MRLDALGIGPRCQIRNFPRSNWFRSNESRFCAINAWNVGRPFLSSLTLTQFVTLLKSVKFNISS